MKVFDVADPLDRRDLLLLALHRQLSAALHGSTIDEHCAGTTLAGVATDVGAGGIQLVSKKMNQEGSGLDNRGAERAVDTEGDRALHEPELLAGKGARDLREEC